VKQRGSALVMALLLLTVAQALILAVTTRAMLAAQAARRAETRSRALNAAEAGLADAVQRLLEDNAASRGEGELGVTCEWEVEADEELVEPRFSVATFTSTGRCADQSRRIRLRVVIERDDVLAIRDLRRLDWVLVP